MDGNAILTTAGPILAMGVGGAALGVALEYVVIKPMSKGNQDWVAPVTYALVGMGIGLYQRFM